MLLCFYLKNLIISSQANRYIIIICDHLLQINGINGTMIANRYESFGATTNIIRTVITLDNGGEWNYLTPPEFNLTGAPVLCEPPACSLHFQMASSEYARLGVYSQVNYIID